MQDGFFIYVLSILLRSELYSASKAAQQMCGFLFFVFKSLFSRRQNNISVFDRAMITLNQ